MTSRSDRHPELLPWFASGRLDPADAEAIDRHLQGCEACHAEVSALRSMYRSIRARGPADHVPPARLVAYRAGDPPISEIERRSIRQHVEACHTCAADLKALARAEGSTRGRRARALFAVAASVLIVVTAGWRLASWRGESMVSVAEASVEFTPPQRGEVTEPTLSGAGPWVAKTWLPVLASARAYRARILRDDEPSRQLPEAVVAPSPKDDSLLVTIPADLPPGRYHLYLTPRDADGSENISYPFLVVSPR